MVDSSHILTPFSIQRTAPLLRELFDIDDVLDHRFVHGGYMGQNFRIDTSQGVFFLKQYRNRINTIIHEIKAAEAYFSQEGLPVITPLKDRYGREAFWLDGNWFSLFPYVDGTSPDYGSVTQTYVENAAQLLARFHRVGLKFPQRPFQMLRIGNVRKFTLEVTELLHQLRQKPTRSDLEQKMLDILERKAELVAKATVQSQDFRLAYDCLLHGDYQYLNMFVDEQQRITHVYDLERASLGPPSYEVVRSLILNCFDDGWEEKNFQLGRAHLRAYKEEFPLTREEFLLALRLYAFSIMHMTWIEARYLVFGVETQLPIFERHAQRLDQLTSGNQESFCERVWE